MGYHHCICPKFVNQQLAQLDMLHEALITSGCHVVELPILKIIFFLHLLGTGTVWITVFETSIWHTRLRLGISQLSAHLFLFGFVESPRCFCGVTHETVPHYFLDCPLYAAQRERLLVDIRNIISPTLHPATLPILDKDAYIKILLFGSKDLSSEENILLFRATQNFILNSDRFSQHNNIL